MKTIANTRLINRNKKISQYATYGALAFFAFGFYFTLKTDSISMILSLAALLLGIIVWQISMSYTAKFGAKVCPYEMIADSLKGLDGKFTLYQFSTPVSHLLTSPSGLWIIIPQLASGKISYEKGRWHQKGANFLFRLFAQDNIGKPDIEARMEQESLLRAMNREGIQIEPRLIKPLILFLNPKVELELSDVPLTCMTADKVKDFLRKLPSANGLTSEQLKSIDLISTIKAN